MGVWCLSKGAVNVPARASDAGASLCWVVGHPKHVKAGGAWVFAKCLAVEVAKPFADLLFSTQSCGVCDTLENKHTTWRAPLMLAGWSLNTSKRYRDVSCLMLSMIFGANGCVRSIPRTAQPTMGRGFNEYGRCISSVIKSPSIQQRMHQCFFRLTKYFDLVFSPSTEPGSIAHLLRERCRSSCSNTSGLCCSNALPMDVRPILFLVSSASSRSTSRAAYMQC